MKRQQLRYYYYFYLSISLYHTDIKRNEMLNKILSFDRLLLSLLPLSLCGVSNKQKLSVRTSGL